ncbi:MAG TPA: ATP-dependent DNA helicase [Rhodopila sp.]|uniref:ATP-dependent DNA helicase n=1 Tax=Rhodopila sp. TaxID=2480087 RepID=UPI002C127B63|nr:ATP-dependent DNA helicase [Rhodopila sp.]HVY17280.1 ATP-dependent DNA helicase [Rhodopila sp.]
MTASIVLPDAPCVVAGHGRAAVLTPDGELLVLPSAQAADILRKLPPPLLVHAPATFRRLGMRPSQAFDLLDLFAFVRPAETAAPTPRGLALALDDPNPIRTLEDEVTRLPDLAAVLLNQLAQARDTLLNRDAAALAARMQQAGWPWGGYVTHALGRPDAGGSNEPLKVWKTLPEWEEVAPPPAPSAHPVSAVEARNRLAEMLGPHAEQRPGQSDYASAAAGAFAPRLTKGDPHLVLAEAGTGTGKTLGYLAPTLLWAEKNRGAVWISTFTRHLQRQIDAELARVIPDPTTRRRRIVVRKGRENYLCLLNLEDAVNAAGGGFMNQSLVPLGLIARWAKISDDGDIQGGDLPGWLAELHGPALVSSLADRRGECIHAACPHYRRCFIEHTIRRSRTADLVVANHALVMAQAAWGGLDDSTVPTRYVFDEGHHLFEAADSAFSAVLSGLETAELRRWLRGSEGARSRARGLRRRVEDLIADRPDLQTPLDAALHATTALPPSDWASRMREEGPELGGVEPAQRNPTEAFLRVVRHQVLARAQGQETTRATSFECDVAPPHPDLLPAAETLHRALGRIIEPLELFRIRLLALLTDEPEGLEETERLRIEAIARSLDRRALMPLKAWREMLAEVIGDEREPGERPAQVLFLRLDRRDATHDTDIGLHRHWLDPTIPFAATLATPASGLLVTSATLRDSGEQDPELAWDVAEARVGAPHLPSPAIRAAVASPFDYRAQTRTFVVTDVAAGDLDQLASAYGALFKAAGGGALGLFTAIARLRAVHQRIAPALEAAGIPLYAQHVDAMGNATLVDIFRAEEESCLLGTDAMRDGVDVPGNALRLVVFERTPWPRPDILHRERRVHLSGGDPKTYDDRIVRLRLRQAFGRLIRRASDRGVFVLLDRQAPSRIMSAFPDGIVVRRVGLAQAIAETTAFLASPHAQDHAFLQRE